MTTSAHERRDLVLIVDDDAGQRTVGRAVLEAEGFEVTEAADGVEALESVAQRMPDIIVMDVEMPRMNGFLCCRRMREDPATRQVPIVMATGLDDDESVTRAYSEGATDFTNKPTNWAALPHRLRFALRAARDLRRVQQYADHNDALLRALPDRVMRLRPDGELIDSDWTSARELQPARQLETLEGIVGAAPMVAVQRMLRSAAESGELGTIEYQVAAEDFTRIKELRVTRCGTDDLLAVERDITEAREAQARIGRLAYFDPLTGLPNRQWLIDEMDRRIAATEYPFVLLLFGLDHFRLVNDLLGYDGGNDFLKTICARVASCLDTDGMQLSLARVSGDQLAVVVPALGSEDSVDRLVATITAVIAQPMKFASQELVVTASSASCRFPGDADTSVRLLQDAELALRDAKLAGRNTHRPFDADMRRKSSDQIDLVSRLRKALEADQLQLHFQPKIDLRTGRLTGFEALLRWHCARDGWIPPSRFIPLAEESGLIVPLTEWVLHAALRMARRWHQRTGHLVPVAVNISARQFALRDPAALIAQALQLTGSAAATLEVEITESAVMGDLSKAVAVLSQLRQLGVRSSIDDFGTGQSSLAYLKDLPVDTVKIDRGFIAGLGEASSPSNQICLAIVGLGHALGFEVVAEGVETAEQLEMLRAMGCDQAQGYLIARPMDAEQSLALLLQSPDQSPMLRAV